MISGKKPTEILREEHENVLRKLCALDEVIDNLDQKEEMSARLEELASFFKTDFWIHFTKEEEGLFPEIEKLMPRESGPLGVMLAEHDDLRDVNTELQRAIDVYFRDSDDSEPKGLIQRHGAHFIGVLRDHIYKENNILFMMADMHLDETQIDKVAKVFAEIEGRGG